MYLWWTAREPSSRARSFALSSRASASSLIVSSAYHDSENINAKVERANGVVSYTLRASAEGCKDDWDSNQTLTVFQVAK